MKHLKYILEYNKEIKTPNGVWRVKQKSDESITIDLDNKKSKIEINKRYNFLDVKFTPKYNDISKSYYTIIQKNGVDTQDKFPGWVIYSETLTELKNKIRFRIKEYIQAIKDGNIDEKYNFTRLKSYKLFLEYNKDIQNKIDYILDKISRSGINSLYPEERNLLDSYKKGEEETNRALNSLTQKENEKKYNLIELGSTIATFIYRRSEKVSKDGVPYVKHYGTFELPDLVLGDDSVIEGTIDGYIIEDLITKTIDIHFFKGEFTAFDFMEGLEHEFDNFVIDILEDLNKHK